MELCLLVVYLCNFFLWKATLWILHKKLIVTNGCTKHIIYWLITCISENLFSSEVNDKQCWWSTNKWTSNWKKWFHYIVLKRLHQKWHSMLCNICSSVVRDHEMQIRWEVYFWIWLLEIAGRWYLFCFFFVMCDQTSICKNANWQQSHFGDFVNVKQNIFQEFKKFSECMLCSAKSNKSTRVVYQTKQF